MCGVPSKLTYGFPCQKEPAVPDIPSEFQLVLSINDLEALALAELFQFNGQTVQDLRLDWGAIPDKGQLAQTVQHSNGNDRRLVLCEIPQFNPSYIDKGRAHPLVIDHHVYVRDDGTLLNRTHDLSSLEQAALLLGIPLSPVQHWIAANDRGYWGALWKTVAQPPSSLDRERFPWLDVGVAFVDRLSVTN